VSKQQLELLTTLQADPGVMRGVALKGGAKQSARGLVSLGWLGVVDAVLVGPGPRGRKVYADGFYFLTEAGARRLANPAEPYPGEAVWPHHCEFCKAPLTAPGLACPYCAKLKVNQPAKAKPIKRGGREGKCEKCGTPYPNGMTGSCWMCGFDRHQHADTQEPQQVAA
jgi:hypothetical protein